MGSDCIRLLSVGTPLTTEKNICAALTLVYILDHVRRKKSMYVQVFSEDTNGTFLQNFICKLFHMLKMLEQYIGNDGTHSLRAKLVWSLVTIKVPKRSYHVELLTDIWSNKYKNKWIH